MYIPAHTLTYYYQLDQEDSVSSAESPHCLTVAKLEEIIVLFSCSCLNFLHSMFSFCADFLDDLKLLFLEPSVALGEQPAFRFRHEETHVKTNTVGFFFFLFFIRGTERDDHGGSGQELR